jgi:hypothetical protein
MSATTPSASQATRGHRGIAYTLAVVATLLAFLSIFAIWANRQLLNTDNWANTSSQLLEDKHIRTAVAGIMVDQLYANVDVTARVREALPRRAQPLAGAAAGALRNAANQAAIQLLQRPRVQAAWENANRRMHKVALKIVNGEGKSVSTNNGVVALDIGSLVQQLANTSGVGGTLAGKLKPGQAKIVLFKSSQLRTVQDIVSAMRPLAILLLALAIGLYAAAIALGRPRRREMLRAAGFGLIIAGGLALVARSVGGNAVVSSLAKTDAAKPAVESVWRIGTSLLSEAATAAIGYGVVIVFAAWLAGTTNAAVATRRALAPYLRDPGYAYGGLAVIVLLVLLWGPTPATRHFLPAVLLIALAAVGVEALRRQTEREFPDAVRVPFGESLRNTYARVRAKPAAAASAGNGAAAPEAVLVDDSLAQLERLADLRDRGVLTDDEFAAEKRAILRPSVAAQ